MQTQEITVLVYYVPQYCSDPCNNAFLVDGASKWDSLRIAKSRFARHAQPVQPSWGKLDESDSDWADREINLAANQSVGQFLCDWYEGKFFLETALEQRLLTFEYQVRADRGESRLDATPVRGQP